MIKKKTKELIAGIVRCIPDSVFREMSDPTNRIYAEQKQANLRKKVKSNVRVEEEWSPEAKIFGIGLSRTGTNSLTRALEILGYERSLHWKHNRKVLGWPEFFYADAATDTPCSAQFEALYHAFEGSKFIYTTRDLQSWKRSIRNHFGVEQPADLRRLHGRADLWGEGTDWNFYNAIRKIQIREGLYARYDSWEEAYHSHNERVHRFFDDKTDDEFLEINIVGGDGWDVLCPFLEADTPNQTFPHTNKSEEE